MKTKLHANQQGLGAILVIVIIAVILAVAGGTYYMLTKNKDSGSNPSASNNAASKELQDACNKELDDKDFCKFVSNWSFGGEMKMTMTTSDDSAVTVIETDANGNSRMTTSQDGSESYAVINIGNASYIKNVDEGNWMKYESQETEDTSNTVDELAEDFDFDEEISRDTSKITSQGKEACGSLNCFKYSITDSSAPGEETIVWFDDKDYLLRRMSSTTSDGRTDMVVEYEVADITEPSPVVDMPDFNEGMSQEELQQLMEQYAQ